MLKSGYVCIIGRPNAGKSTLLNQILKTELSIVTPKAQTTRNKILGIYTEEKGQIIFMDTPGIHLARKGGINAFMVDEAIHALDASHFIWYLIDPHTEVKHEEIIMQHLIHKKIPFFLLINKIDSVRNPLSLESVRAIQKKLESFFNENNSMLKQSFEISALHGAGVDLLLEKTWEALPEGAFFYPDSDDISDRPFRFFVGEKIRKQLYYCLGQELPYSCAIKIEVFKEKVQPLRIEAIIYVERETQKAMVIGSQGKKIKEIGKAARHEIELFLNKKIFLGLKVKVLKEWSRNADSLKKMGYLLPKRQKV